MSSSKAINSNIELLKIDDEAALRTAILPAIHRNPLYLKIDLE